MPSQHELMDMIQRAAETAELGGVPESDEGADVFDVTALRVDISESTAGEIPTSLRPGLSPRSPPAGARMFSPSEWRATQERRSLGIRVGPQQMDPRRTSEASAGSPERRPSRPISYPTLSGASAGSPKRRPSRPISYPTFRRRSGRDSSSKGLVLPFRRESSQKATAVTKAKAHVATARALQEQQGGYSGAESLFSSDGLDPFMWGVSKGQLQQFAEMVAEAVAKGEIQNTSPDGTPTYPQAKFDDQRIGPNMHQVNAGLIKPYTASALDYIPGASWALHKNHLSGGLPCHLFFSHAWNEGVYEFIDNALAAWDDDVEGAYICCLSNPQNLDIGRMLGERIEDSPFYRVLMGKPHPQRMIMLANSNTPIHSRAWCLLEAFCATHLGIVIQISGNPLDLLTGRARQGLLLKEAAAKAARREVEAMTSEEAAAPVDSPLRLPSRLPSPYGAHHEVAHELESLEEDSLLFAAATQTLEAVETDLAQVKLAVLGEAGERLINLKAATCTRSEDESAIREIMLNRDLELTELLASLIKDHICGIDHHAGGETLPGPLGMLPLLPRPLVELPPAADLSNSQQLLHLVSWLRTEPQTTKLRLRSCSMPQIGIDLIDSLLHAPHRLAAIRKLDLRGNDNLDLSRLVQVTAVDESPMSAIDCHQAPLSLVAIKHHCHWVPSSTIAIDCHRLPLIAIDMAFVAWAASCRRAPAEASDSSRARSRRTLSGTPRHGGRFEPFRAARLPFRACSARLSMPHRLDCTGTAATPSTCATLARGRGATRSSSPPSTPWLLRALTCLVRSTRPASSTTPEAEVRRCAMRPRLSDTRALAPYASMPTPSPRPLSAWTPTGRAT